MKQRLYIFGGLFIIVLILIGLNAAAFSRKNKLPDNEFYPNRSTYNSDSTGTRAIYELLAETGRKVIRWQEKPSTLLANTKNRPSVFVIIGKTRREITDTDAESIMRWVSEGGRLVIIDREPMSELVKTTSGWEVGFELSKNVEVAISTDPKELTEKSDSLKPIQPTTYTRGVNSIKPSVLASQINLKFLDASSKNENPVVGDKFKIGDSEKEEELSSVPKSFEIPTPTVTPTVQPSNARPKGDFSISTPEIKPTPKPSDESDTQPPIISSTSETTNESAGEPFLNAPVVHFANDKKTILADFPFGAGEVVFLSDPFIIANNGLKLADNSQLAINILTSSNGITAFDEYHQGFGKSDDRLSAYFEGTPVIAILAQIALFFGLFFWSGGRRFARALPNGELNRLSKLEYVTAMAEIQENIKAYDLAIDNIYSEFKRNLIRFTGSDNTTSNENLAFLVAEKSDVNLAELINFMNECEAIHHGEKTNKTEVLRLTIKLREFEETIGIKRVKRRKL